MLVSLFVYLCMHTCKRMHTQIYQPIHTLGRERIISKSILWGENERREKRRVSKPAPVLADCKGLSVTAAFYWAKGKQQDSTRGPIKGYSSWKSALAHGLECTRALISRAVGAHSKCTGRATPAGPAVHADVITHHLANAEAITGLMLRHWNLWFLDSSHSNSLKQYATYTHSASGKTCSSTILQNQIGKYVGFVYHCLMHAKWFPTDVFCMWLCAAACICFFSVKTLDRLSVNDLTGNKLKLSATE